MARHADGCWSGGWQRPSAAWTTDPTDAAVVPEWCEEPEGHGFDSIKPETGEVVRSHERIFATGGEVGAGAWLATDETAAGEAGPVTETSPPRIFVSVNEWKGITGPVARALAEALVKAADAWDEV